MSIEGALIINDSNVNTGIVYKNKEIINNINNWHKFTIYGTEGLTRDAVLKQLIDHVHPLDLIPVHYSQNGCTSQFIARSCGPAIQKFCYDNLLVSNIYNPQKPFKLTITLQYATTKDIVIDIQKNIEMVLNKNYIPTTKTLCLDRFHEDKDLEEFCLLSQPKIMYFVLQIARKLYRGLQRIQLRNNFIKILSPFETLQSLPLKSIDLRDNLIDNINDLNCLTPFKSLTRIYLDENPLCNCEEEIYLKTILNLFPNIERIDGIQIKKDGFAAPLRNFVCNSEGRDLVNAFMEHYFTLYDSANRMVLMGLYHKNAMFSMTVSYQPGQLSSTTARLKSYNCKSRNLCLMADFSRSEQYLFRGNSNIVKLFSELPLSEHDRYSFTADLIYYTANCAIIVITGTFKELPAYLLDTERFISFSRMFTLEAVNGEYCIINEQLHLYNALSSQQLNAFKIPLKQTDNLLMKPTSAKDQAKFEQVMQLLTNLNSHWTKKCLEKTDYDLKGALEYFINLYKSDELPSNAFENYLS